MTISIQSQNDDGFILYESRAICQYIATKYADQGTRLIPNELQAKALFYQASSVETANFDPCAHKAVLEMVFKPCVVDSDLLQDGLTHTHAGCSE